MSSHSQDGARWEWRWLWAMGLVFVAPAVGQPIVSSQHPLPDVAGQSFDDDSPLAYALPVERQLPIPLYFESKSALGAQNPSDGAADDLPQDAADIEGNVQRAGFTQSLPVGFPARIRGSSATPRTSNRPPLTSVAGALAMVLGLFLSLVWLSRKSGRWGGGRLPSEVVRTLGRFPLGHRQELHVVRFGSKVLALAVSATKTETLGELSHPDEVDRITRACLSGEPTAPENIQDMLARLSAESGEYLADSHVRQVR